MRSEYNHSTTSETQNLSVNASKKQKSMMGECVELQPSQSFAESELPSNKDADTKGNSKPVRTSKRQLLFYTANYDGLLDLITSWCGTFINTSTFIKRLDTGDGDYLFDAQDDPKVRYWTSSVFNFVEHSLAECSKFADLFQKFSFQV